MNGANDRAGAGTRPPVAGGFVKLMRGDDTRDLLEFHPVDFWLLSLVAYRARRTSGGGLQPGEALIGVGDITRVGFTARSYRTAKKRLETCHKVTTRTTSRGTIIKLTDASIYDINGFQNDKPSDKQTTTNKNVRINTKDKDKKEEARAHKRLHLDFIELTDSELEKLKAEYGNDRTMTAIRELNDYIGATEKRYKSHFFALRNWLNRDFSKGGHHERGTSTSTGANRCYRHRIGGGTGDLDTQSWPDDTPRD